MKVPVALVSLFVALVAGAVVVAGIDGAPRASSSPTITSEVFVPAAEFPVALAFAPDGRLFYNELRTGKVRVVENGVLLPTPFATLPAVTVSFEHGLLGLVLAPDFENNHYIYVLNSLPGEDGNAQKNQIIRFTEVNNVGTNETLIVDDLPVGFCCHDGGGMVFGRDGKLYVSVGENQVPADAQDPNSVRGKILRYNRDGTIPVDNPIPSSPVYALGFRNPFAFTEHPLIDAFFVTDNGPERCDELNLVVESGNYGWPDPYLPDSCDVALGTQPMYLFAKDGFQPWDIASPVAPAGIEYIDGDVYPALGDSLLVCEWNTARMRHLGLAQPDLDAVVGDDVLVNDCRLDVTIGPDGAIYYSDDTTIRRLLVDSDSDTVIDGADNCPADPNPGQENTDADLGGAGAAFNGFPIGDGLGDVCDDDDDDDGFTDATENTIGTAPDDNCAGAPGPGGDAWPADFDMNGWVNILDAVQMTPPVFDSQPPDPSYTIRKDFDANGWINILDFLRIAPPVFNSTCS